MELSWFFIAKEQPLELFEHEAGKDVCNNTTFLFQVEEGNMYTYSKINRIRNSMIYLVVHFNSFSTLDMMALPNATSKSRKENQSTSITESNML